MVPGGSAGLAAEEGGRNALYVRVDIGSLEVGPSSPRRPSDPILHLHHIRESLYGARANLTQ